MNSLSSRSSCLHVPPGVSVSALPLSVDACSSRVRSAIVVLVTMMAILFGTDALASHFRGGSVTHRISASGIVTVEVYTVWRSDFIDNPNFQIYSGPNGTGTVVATATTSSHNQSYALGFELGGSPYAVNRTVQTFDLSSLGEGRYYAWWSSCCRVDGTNNATSNDSWDLETGIVWTGTAANRVTSTEPNSMLGTAQTLESADWALLNSDKIAESSTIPHVTVNGTGNGTMDYFAFNVNTVGSLGIFDVDTMANGVDAALFLYDATGNLLASNDNASSSLGGTGSGTPSVGNDFDLDLETLNWTVSNDSDILDSTIVPHVSVTATGDGTANGYTFRVPTAGTVGTFDIDYTGGWDSYLRLYDEAGNLVVSSDDSDPSLGAGGSTSFGDTFFQFTFPQSGVYHIEVGSCCGANTTVPSGRSYTLQISVQGHPLGLGTPIMGSADVDPYIDHTFAAAGTYYIGIAATGAVGAQGGITGAALGNGNVYELQVSVANHANVGTGYVASSSPAQREATIDVVARGYTYTQNLNSVDPDGTPVSYEFIVGSASPHYGPSSQIPGINIDGLGNVNISAANTASLTLGRWAYKTRVTDGQGAFSERDVLVVVENASSGPGLNPTAPILAPINPQTVAVGSTLTFPVTATDADNTNVTVRAQLLPTGSALPETTALSSVASAFTWTPQPGQEGVYIINVEAFDNVQVPIIDSQLVTITVTGANNPPVLAAIGPQSVANGGTLSFQVSGSDPNNDSLTYEAFFLPFGATFNPASRTFTWTPVAGQYNNTVTNVTFRVTDDGIPNLNDEEAINITVGAGNIAPIIEPIADFTTLINQPLSLPISITDSPGQTITVTAPNVPLGSSFTAVPGQSPINASFTWTPTLVGQYQLRIRAEDNGIPILSSFRDITITVTDVLPTPAVITDEPDSGSYQAYETVTLSVTATGTPAPTYQWSKDGTPIDGATSSQYIVSSLTRLTAGSYTVVASNTFGSDTSVPAVLTVLTRELLRTDDDMVVPGFPVTDLYRPLSGVIGPNGAFVINALATVGPGGITAGNDQVIITNVSGSLSAIGQESQIVGSGTLSRLFYYMNAPANGTAHYRAILNGGTAANDTAYFFSPDGQSLNILSREGDEAPEGTVTFSGHIAPQAISQSGIVYFDSKLMGSGVTTKNDTGVWFDNEGDQGTLMREGERAPTGSSVADQAWFGQILTGSVVAGADTASFIADLQADPLNAANKTAGLRNSAIFTGSVGDMSLVSRKGDVIADLPIRGFNAVAVSPDGGHAFVSQLTQGGAVTTNNALALFYKPANGPAVLVAQKGQTLSTAGVINVFERLFAADDGQVIFEVTLSTAANSDNALCRWTAADGIEVLMQEGDNSPGTGVYGALRSISVSGKGMLMIQDSRALWRDVGSGMEMVVKVGDTVSYGGLPRTALSLAVNDEMGNTRRAGGGFGGTINDDGVVLVIMSVGSGQYTTQIFP